MTWTAPRVERVDEPFAGDERSILEGLLDYNRASLLAKCAALAPEQLAERSCPPSNLSLLGIIRHETDVERNWFRRRFAGLDIPPRFTGESAFEEACAATAQQDWEALVAEQAAAREAVAHLPLDAVFVSDKWGPMSLRWLYSHMISEYAGHCGQADLLRERIDGATRL